VQKSKRELTEKERRLEEERKSVRLEKDSALFKHQKEVQQLQSKELTKLLLFSAICFFLGAGVAIFFLNSSTA